MEKVKYLPLALFALFSGKVLLFGTNLESSLTLLVLGVIAAYYEFKIQNKLINEVQSNMVNLEKQLKDLSKDHDSLKSHFSSIKLGNQIRTTTKAI